MGKILQIRVSAYTYSEDEVRTQWPNLWKLVWAEGGHQVRKKGVDDLAQLVFDQARIGYFQKEWNKALLPEAEEAERIRLALNEALGRWDAKGADELTYALEDALGRLEDIAEKF